MAGEAAIVKAIRKAKAPKSPEAIAKAKVTAAGKGVKKRAATMKKAATQKKMAKDKERKAARGAARQVKKESKQKVAVYKKPEISTTSSGLAPARKPSSNVATSKKDIGPARQPRTEKVVKGERVDGSGLPPKPSAPAKGRGNYKKAATAIAAGTAAGVGAAYVASNEQRKARGATAKKEAPKAAPKVAPKAAPAAATKAPSKSGKLSEFGSAFKEARKKRLASGESMDTATFEFKGKKYHTRTKDEEAKRGKKK